MKAKRHPNQLALELKMDEQATILDELRLIVQLYQRKKARLDQLRRECARLECVA